MWALAYSIFWGCKWLSWWKACLKIDGVGARRSLAYLFAWPGMDAEAFLDVKWRAERPQRSEWLRASAKTGLGAVLLWFVVRHIPAEMMAGWVGMLGLVLILHFGVFELLSLFWRSTGINAQPIMRSPVLATSLGDFWGKRWNLGFRQLTYDLIFRPIQARTDAGFALLMSFLASGLIHDLVISFPARGGYGLPTAYFLLQGYGILLERSALGKRLGLGSGVRGWLFMAVWAGGPACILFHPWFVELVMMPFLGAIGAR
ncbi:MAG TPA: membrane bound O-acyl transferase family-domain-containing protein [Terriglobales bacterium]|nr:membrane bound O-acyl transferase family-domain-containing protein [Terriglobales bacterium]